MPLDHRGRYATAGHDSVGDTRSEKGRLSRRALKAALAVPELAAKRRPGPRILIYHLVGTNLGREMEVATETFANQIRYLQAEGSIVSLGDAVSRIGMPGDDRLFVLTFDDGYANCLSRAAPICERFGIHPTVFVNGRFSKQEDVYYRVRLHGLVARGHAETAAGADNRDFKTGEFTSTNVLRLSKQRYSYPETQSAAGQAWNDAFGGRPVPRAHLTFDELRTLRQRGWEVGNHTLEHATLGG